MFLGNREFIDCSECPHCKKQPDPYKGIRGHGVKYGICGMGGNLVYLEPWKERRICGSGWIHYHVSSCALYEKKEENSHEEN